MEKTKLLQQHCSLQIGVLHKVITYVTSYIIDTSIYDNTTILAIAPLLPLMVSIPTTIVMDMAHVTG